MRELIRGYAAATFETVQSNGKSATMVSDLVGFRRALEDSQALRSALTDASLSAEVRRDIVVDLLTDRAIPEMTELLSFTVRYEHAGELASTTTALVLGAEQAAASDPTQIAIPEPQADRGAARERIRGYAERALQELGAIDVIDEVEDELFRFARLLDDNVALRRVLQDVNSAYTGRVGIVSDLLDGRVQPATLRIAKYVLRAGRTRDLVGVFDRLVELAAAERGRRVGEVRSAVPLDEAETARLAVALGRLVERPVEVRVIHDPKVIGGMLVSVGDLVIDATVRIRFERLRDLLAEAS